MNDNPRTSARHWQLIKPAEHGTWSLLLTPYLIGVGLAVGTESLARLPGLGAALFLLAALAGLFIRQPVSLLVRIWRGRARRDRAQLALTWVGLLGGVLALAGGALLALGRLDLLWLLPFALLALVVALALEVWRGPRGLLLEVAGVLGLAIAAPGAYVALAGALDGLAGVAYAIAAAHSVVSIIYVRLRVDSVHDRVVDGTRRLVAVAHSVAFGLALLAGLMKILPLLVAVAFGLLLARALWVAWRVPPLRDVRRFGFTEMGLALAFAVVVLVAYVL